ncbi:MAG: helicase C-terminal domain-containing protein, partial [Promethearchaeota archaeon]
RVIEELRAIVAKRGHQIKGISIGGKHVMCIKSNVRDILDAEILNDTCNAIKKKCSFFQRTKGFNIKFLLDKLNKCPMTSQDVRKFSKMHGLCPFELQKKLLPHMDVITLSYQYFFNPILRYYVIERFIELANCFIILDEAHNLPSIVKSIISIKLKLSSLKNALEEVQTYPHIVQLKNPEIISNFLSNIYVKTIEYARSRRLRENKEIKITSRKEKETFRSHISLCTDLDEQEVNFLIDRMITWGEIIRDYRTSKENVARSSLYKVGKFLKSMEKAVTDPVFEVILKKLKFHSKEIFLLEIISFDPRPITQPLFDRVHGSLAMSGTMQPLNAYADVVGILSPLCQAFSSPYSKDNFLVLATPKLHTKGGGRNMASGMQKVYVERIMEVVKNTDGNTGVFCSSYGVLSLLEPLLSNKIDKIGKFLFVEKTDMTTYWNDKMIREFKAHGNLSGAVLLGVIGGRNSEGQDFPGKEMSSVCIIGVPFSQWNVRTKLEIQYNDQVFPKKGRLYCYTIPAIRRAAQAAGRSIRSLSDKAVIIFMDQRYLYRAYNRFLPMWLRENMKQANIKRGNLGDIVNRFFR